MTEADWLGCNDPSKMLPFVQGKASERKLRLFACACCRRVWDLLPKDGRKAVKVAEKFADGLAGLEELRRAAHRIERICRDKARAWRSRARQAAVAADAAFGATDRGERMAPMVARSAAGLLSMLGVVEHSAGLRLGVLGVDEAGLWVVRWRKGRGKKKERERKRERHAMEASENEWGPERRAQADLLRCILGNPFRAVITHSAIHVWNDKTVRRIAQTIYDESAFDCMAVLADALEDAGCTGEELLAHCRAGGEHVRGCWAVDLLLGKE
jgi:hypothetical protein